MDFQRIRSVFQISPSIDGFASAENHKCAKYFSRIPDPKACATNFFFQPLDSREIYYLVPPVKLVAKTWFAIKDIPNLTIVLCVPLWYSFNYMALFREAGEFHNITKNHLIFKAQFGQSDDSIFNKDANFYMLALLIKT